MSKQDAKKLGVKHRAVVNRKANNAKREARRLAKAAKNMMFAAKTYLAAFARG